MSEELKFFILLIEKYAYDHSRPTADVLREWDKAGITKEIYDSYWQYHQESIENAYLDIDSLLKTGRHYTLNIKYEEDDSVYRELKIAEPGTEYNPE